MFPNMPSLRCRPSSHWISRPEALRHVLGPQGAGDPIPSGIRVQDELPDPQPLAADYLFTEKLQSYSRPLTVIRTE